MEQVSKTNQHFLNVRLLKAEEVARRLSISKALAYRMMQTSEIPTVHIHKAVRVRENDLESFIQRSWTGWSQDRP